MTKARGALTLLRRFSSSHTKPIQIPLASPDELRGHEDIASDPAAHIHLINKIRHEKLGPVYNEKIGPDVELTFIACPDLCAQVLSSEGSYPRHLVPRPWEVFNERQNVQRGLFFLDGQEWSSMRSKLNKILLDKSIDSIKNLSTIPDYARASGDNLIDKLEKLGIRIDTWREWEEPEKDLSHWAVESTLRYLFGNNFADGNPSAIPHLVEAVKNIFATSAELQFKSADAEADANSELWQFFSQSASDALEIAGDLTMNNISNNISEKKGLVAKMHRIFSVNEIKAIVTDLIIAAADTTATTAAWTLHLLATCGSQSEMLGNNTEIIFARGCIKEAMRLYPVAPFITRILPKNLCLSGYEPVPANRLVLLSVYAMSRNEELFHRANEFRPERFIRKAGQREGIKDPRGFMPFGHGARNCIGRKIAMEQLTYLVTRMTQRFQMKSMNETPVRMIMKYTGTPDQKIRLAMKKCDIF